MRKIPKATFALMTVLLLSSALIFQSPRVNAESNTITVPDDYPTISSAIGNSTEGITILVKQGTYEEQTLVIDKTLTLIGAGAESTTISCHPQWVFTGGFHLNGTGVQPDYGYDSPIKITGNNVSFSGFKIVSDQSSSISINGIGAIIVFNNITTPLTISGNAQNITGNFLNSGLLCAGGENHVISSNQIIDGIYTMASQCAIINNTFSGKYGVMMGGNNNKIFNNTIQNTGCALYFWAYAVSNSIYGNNFINNSRQVQIGEVYNSTVAKWDNGEVGNFWSDFNGQGNYVIDQNNIDYYPLSEPYHMSTKSVSNLDTALLIAIITVAITAGIVSLLLFRRHRKTTNLKQ
ncbi:MAG: hypothetical protein NWE93_07180 [Candidatus Bathyarchaeota archaeon]|nr:hypothetical protein [Candidatus Bathyarchaeota archaeon]